MNAMNVLRIIKSESLTKCCGKLLQNSSPIEIFRAQFSKLSEYPWTQKLELLKAENIPKIPAYRVLDEEGNVLDPSQEPKLDGSLLVELYKGMVKLNITEKIFYESQRQGRISFYMTSFGEEAIQFGCAAAFSNDDLIYGQYRESGVLMWRGFTIQNMADQCFGNDNDVAKGKQMPAHYGSKILRFVTISSPLTTQLPQAVGSAYACKRAKNGQCVGVFFGEGAASEGDAHAAFNFAAVLQTPTIFVCRNNGYAISTPSYEQYSGDGIACKGPAYGIATIRVDGNDLLAVYNAVTAARQYSLSNNRPSLIEALTYRVSHHSTSDDSTAYRSEDEVKQWQKRNNPVNRFRSYLKSKQLWDSTHHEEYEKNIRNQVLEAIKQAENTKKPSWTEMFREVYSEMPTNLLKQKTMMSEHLNKYGEFYPRSSQHKI